MPSPRQPEPHQAPARNNTAEVPPVEDDGGPARPTCPAEAERHEPSRTTSPNRTSTVKAGRRRYPLDPVARAFGIPLGIIATRGTVPPGEPTYSDLAEASAIKVATLRRWRDDGVPAARTIELADVVRVPRYALWPEMVAHDLADAATDCADPTCPNTFTKTHHSEKYCSPPCRLRTNSRNHNRNRYQSDPAYREAKKAASRKASRDLWANGSEAWKRQQRERLRTWRAAQAAEKRQSVSPPPYTAEVDDSGADDQRGGTPQNTSEAA